MEEGMMERWSERQKEVIALCGGEFLSYREAAERLDLSTRTVEGYAQEIRDSSGLKMRPRDALIRIALEKVLP